MAWGAKIKKSPATFRLRAQLSNNGDYSDFARRVNRASFAIDMTSHPSFHALFKASAGFVDMGRSFNERMRQQAEAEPFERLRRMPLSVVYAVWFILTSSGASYFWYDAQQYNPNGNNTYNLAETGMYGARWTVAAAANSAAIFTSLAFAVALILRRLWTMAEAQRVANIAVLRELQKISLLLEHPSADKPNF